MVNGFYDMSGVNTPAKIRKFIARAIMLSYAVRCESKYKNDVMGRELETCSSVEEYLNDIMSSKNMRLDCIDRFIYDKGCFSDSAGEVTIHSTFNKKNGRNYWRLLYCLMSLENLNKLVTEYNLKLKKW